MRRIAGPLGQASRDGPASAWHREVWPDLGPATAIVFRSLCCWGKLRDANREASRGDVLTPGLCETNAGRLVTQRRHETTSMSKKTASPAKEDRIKTRPRPDPSKPLRPDLSQMCQKGLPGRLSAMADPRATLILFPSPVVRPIPSRSSRGSPWQQTVACRALPCRGCGQLRSIQSTAAEFWNSSVELVSRDDSLRAEMVRWSSWCSPKTPNLQLEGQTGPDMSSVAGQVNAGRTLSRRLQMTTNRKTAELQLNTGGAAFSLQEPKAPGWGFGTGVLGCRR